MAISMDAIKKLRAMTGAGLADVKKALAGQMYVPFSFENDGTKVIHYSPETYVEK